MLRNLFRQSFWAVFVPLLLAAGLFWMDELRGYRGEMSLLVLPKTEIAKGAAGNLTALSRETSFAENVYKDVEAMLESPFVGKTPAERRAIWKESADVKLVGTSDVIRIVSLGDDQDEAITLSKAIAAEIVRTASRYYNQKTDLDIRIVTEPVAIPSLSAWPRFLAYIIGTALFFTLLFFIVYSLIERIFPKRSMPTLGKSEYVITPDTFKPRVPAYWGRDEHAQATEKNELYDEAAAEPETFSEEAVSPAAEEPVSAALDDTEEEVTDEAYRTDIAPEEWPADLPVEEPVVEEEFTEEEYQPSYEAERAGLTEEVPAGYVSHAAAPDNLPIFEGSITPLQGAQARLMKADIDETAEAYAAMTEPMLPEESAKPQTHEPTPEEYRRRLNELLSGKM